MKMVLCALAVLAGLHQPLALMEPQDVMVQEQRYNGAGECYYTADFAYETGPYQVQRYTYDDDTCCRVYDFNANGKLVRVGNVQDDGSVDIDWQAVFDERGNMLECSLSAAYPERMQYTYDEFGNVLTAHRYENGDMPAEVWVYAYDEEDRCASRKNYVGSGVLNNIMRYEYDGNLLVRREECTAAGELRNWQTYSYTADGRLYKSESGNIYDGLSQWTIYDYDKAGNLLSETLNYNSGESRSRKLEYDAAGHCLADYTYHAGGGVESNDMKYDVRGNLVERVQDLGDGEKTRLVYKYKTVLLPKNLQLRYELTDSMYMDFAFAGN